VSNEVYQRAMVRIAVILAVIYLAMSCCVEARAQGPMTDNPNAYYSAQHSASLSTASDAVTVQGATNSNAVHMKGASVSCSVACTITITQNGTAATATALTITPYNLSPVPTVKAFSGSNASGGQVIGVYTISAGAGNTWIDLTAHQISRGTANSNITVSTSSISGTSYLALYYWETGI
jgi:hypothetical protein